MLIWRERFFFEFWSRNGWFENFGKEMLVWYLSELEIFYEVFTFVLPINQFGKRFQRFNCCNHLLDGLPLQACWRLRYAVPMENTAEISGLLPQNLTWNLKSWWFPKPESPNFQGLLTSGSMLNFAGCISIANWQSLSRNTSSHTC